MKILAMPLVCVCVFVCVCRWCFIGRGTITVVIRACNTVMKFDHKADIILGILWHIDKKNFDFA